MPSLARRPLWMLLLLAVLATPDVAFAPTADVVLEDAARALLRGDDAGALERLEAATRLPDATPQARTALARLLLRQGDLKRAQEVLNDALELAPDDAFALALRGEVLRAAGRVDAADAAYADALAADPDEPVARAGRARIHIAAGRLDAAAAVAAPRDTTTLALRLAWADAEADAGGLEPAIEELNQVLEENPGWIDALVRRGDYHRRLDRMAAAQRDLEQAVRLDPASVEAHFRRGLLYRDLHDIAGALEAFNRAIALAPEFVPAYVARGALYQGVGKQDVAMRDFQVALDLDPQHADALTHVAVSACAQANFASCAAAAGAALAARPDDWRAHVARGHALLGSGDAEAAVAAYGSAIQHAPAGEAQWLLARLQKHLRPRLEERRGFSWQFLAARDTVEVERLMKQR